MCEEVTHLEVCIYQLWLGGSVTDSRNLGPPWQLALLGEESERGEQKSHIAFWSLTFTGGR